MNINPLGRRTPSDFKHVTKYPFSALLDSTSMVVEKKLKLPTWHWQHDQGNEGACVGFGTSMMMSILNEQQARDTSTKPLKHMYDCRWLWNEAKLVDEWSDTNPGDDNGTSVRAACDVLRAQGHVLTRGKKRLSPNPSEGIQVNRWARSVDEIRTAINKNIPLSIGVNWYSNFDQPKTLNKENWIGKGELGSIRGGHCLCLYGASDKREAVILKNSWGKNYPLVWMPYKTLERMISEDGEFALVTDR